MERITGLQATTNGNILGWMTCNGENLVAWKEWFDKNQKKPNQ
ncbi:MAG: hypothetical protein ACT4OJ_08210 [Bacteroidota bacterium]